MVEKKSRFIHWIPVILTFGWFGLHSSNANADEYLVTVNDARIASKKANGKSWDLNFFSSKLPDAYVQVTIGAHRFRTPVVRNSLLPRWNISRRLSVKNTDRVLIAVYDRDRLSRHDLIGSTSMLFSELRRHRSFTFGQVLALRVVVRKLTPPKPPVAVRKPLSRTLTRRVPPRQRAADRKVLPMSKQDSFCLSMIQQSLVCMKKQQAVFLKSGDRNKLKIAAALQSGIKQAEAALKRRGRIFQVMLMRCRGTIKREGWLTTKACRACAMKQGCVSSNDLKSRCKNVCLHKKKSLARKVLDAPPLFPPKAPKRKTKARPAARRAAPVARRAVPVARRAAPAARRAAPVAPRRVAPVAPRRAAPVARRAAPVARRAAPVAPKARPVVKVSIQQFCSAFVSLRINCLKNRVDRVRSRKPSFYKALYGQYRKNLKSYQAKCVTGLQREKKRRSLTPAKLGACWQCLKAASCDASKQRGCRGVCTQ